MKLQTILDYLSLLEQNNNREWFHANKSLYQEASQEFEGLIRELTASLLEIGENIPLLEPKELMFKLTRDTRFSHDKSPYRPAFRAHISAKGKQPIPVGYYLMIRPGGHSFLGGGLFADMFKDATAMVREAIASHSDEWQEIITNPNFAEYFIVHGTTLKNVPRGYDPAHPQAEFLKNKSWFLEYTIPDKQLLEADFPAFAAGIFQRMQPFNAFLNRALETFQMPAR